jgi:hypothetical protein
MNIPVLMDITDERTMEHVPTNMGMRFKNNRIYLIIGDLAIDEKQLGDENGN